MNNTEYYTHDDDTSSDDDEVLILRNTTPTQHNPHQFHLPPFRLGVTAEELTVMLLPQMRYVTYYCDGTCDPFHPQDVRYRRVFHAAYKRYNDDIQLLPGYMYTRTFRREYGFLDLESGLQDMIEDAYLHQNLALAEMCIGYGSGPDRNQRPTHWYSTSSTGVALLIQFFMQQPMQRVQYFFITKHHL